MTNPVVDRERVAFIKARATLRKALLPAWPRSVKELPLVEVEVDWVRFSTLNHRTKAEQLRAIHLAKQPDLFSADPLGKEAQDAQYEILKTQGGFSELKLDLKERGQQEPAVITAEGVLINGNRRTAALRSLYLTDNYLEARYIHCLVLPDDATANELVDLEAELQVARDFKEDYSWINEALLIEELYERERKDFVRVGKKMHRDAADVKGLFEKLQQLHQLVALSKGARLHIDFRENESAFDELAKHIKNKLKAEQDSVRTTYFLGTLTGVNYRTLRHLRRPDASEIVRREMEGDQALKPFLETVRANQPAADDDDPLDELLGQETNPSGLTDLLGYLASQKKDDSIKLVGGEVVTVDQIYGTIRSAITAAAAEAEEDERDQGAVMAPIARITKAIFELEKTLSALPKARLFDGWTEDTFKGKVAEVAALAEKLARTE